MGRVVTVNAQRDSTDPGSEFGIGSIVEGDNYGRDFGIATSLPTAAVDKGPDQGPCLYFGPRGQRCTRRATNAGFCAAHQRDGTPAAVAAETSKPSKKFVASLLAIAAVLWPYLVDIVREVIRWIHAH